MADKKVEKSSHIDKIFAYKNNRDHYCNINEKDLKSCPPHIVIDSLSSVTQMKSFQSFKKSDRCPCSQFNLFNP